MIGELLQQCATSMYLNDPQLKDYLSTQLDCALSAIEEALQVMFGRPSYEVDAETLTQIQLRARRHYRALVSSTSTCSVVSQAVVSPEKLHTGNPGRPGVIVNIEQVELLRTSGFTWEEVSLIISVSRTTLWRRFHQLGVPLQKYSDISDSYLDHSIHNTKQP